MSKSETWGAMWIKPDQGNCKSIQRKTNDMKKLNPRSTAADAAPHRNSSTSSTPERNSPARPSSCNLINSFDLINLLTHLTPWLRLSPSCAIGPRATVLACLVLLGPLHARAVGFRLPNQDPEGIARGNAFAATADNPSAIYYNPAGITQLEGQQAQAGIYVISADTKYTSPSGATAETDSDFQTVPQLHYVNSLKDLPLSFGLGVYAPYGLALDWHNNNPFRTLAQRGKLLYATVNPVIAWRINPTLSIAIGPTINYSKVDFRRGVGFTPDDQLKVTGDGWDYGFNAGLLWKPHPKWSFGLNYHSATEIEYDGDSEATPSPPYPATTSTKGSLQFPQFVAGGIS